MLFSSFNLSQSFNYTPFLFYKKRFKSEINSFCSVYGPQPNFVHIYSYNLWEELRYIERERERGVKNRNLLFSSDGAWEEPSNQSSTQKKQNLFT